LGAHLRSSTRAIIVLDVRASSATSRGKIYGIVGGKEKTTYPNEKNKWEI